LNIKLIDTKIVMGKWNLVDIGISLRKNLHFQERGKTVESR
jgi:hypothetical protein